MVDGCSHIRIWLWYILWWSCPERNTHLDKDQNWAQILVELCGCPKSDVFHDWWVLQVSPSSFYLFLSAMEARNGIQFQGSESHHQPSWLLKNDPFYSYCNIYCNIFSFRFWYHSVGLAMLTHSSFSTRGLNGISRDPRCPKNGLPWCFETTVLRPFLETFFTVEILVETTIKIINAIFVTPKMEIELVKNWRRGTF